MDVKRIRAPEHEAWVYRKDHRTHAKMEEWCIERMGERWSAVTNNSGNWCCFWAGRDRPGYYRWYFSTEEDLLLFTLTWL